MSSNEYCVCCDLYRWDVWCNAGGYCDKCLSWCTEETVYCVVRAAIAASQRDAPLLYKPTEDDHSRA